MAIAPSPTSSIKKVPVPRSGCPSHDNTLSTLPSVATTKIARNTIIPHVILVYKRFLSVAHGIANNTSAMVHALPRAIINVFEFI
jgi:hypothetical protein